MTSILRIDFLNIEDIFPHDIWIKLGIGKNVHIGAYCSFDEVNIYKALFQKFWDIFSWTYEEILSIDQNIVVDEIKKYLDAKPIHQCLCLVHHKKTTTIKAKAKEFMCASFIYPILLSDWVSKIVLIMKKQSTIFVCVYYWDINCSCHK